MGGDDLVGCAVGMFSLTLLGDAVGLNTSPDVVYVRMCVRMYIISVHICPRYHKYTPMYIYTYIPSIPSFTIIFGVGGKSPLNE